MQRTARVVGYVSAILSAVFSITYVIAQLAEWSGLLGSGGGPESLSTPLGVAILLTPSLLLASSFVVLLASIHEIATPEKKIWSQSALAFGIMYATMISIVYFVQLALILPRMARGDMSGVESFVFTPFDSFLYAVDIMGYSLMCISTLFAALVFTGNGIERPIRFFLTANGLLVPFLVFQMYWHSLIWIASLWAITFPGAVIALGIFFRRGDPRIKE